MNICKEKIEAKVLAEYDIANFDENHRMDEDEWNQMLNSGYVAIYTARNEQKEIVAILALKTSSSNTGMWYFFSVAVSKEYRKMKLGTRLFNEAIRGENVTGKMNSHCHIDNTASIRFHKSLGFKTAQYTNDFYGDYEDAIMWEKEF